MTVLEGDLLQIDLQSPHLFAMRRAVRKLAERRLKQAAIDEQLRHRRQAYEAREAERRERDRALAEHLRRTVLRVVPDQGSPAAAALLDIGQRVIRSFVGSELLELPAVLQDYDLIAAIRTRETLYSLGIRDHDHWRLVDLKPPQKTRQLNRAGRKLTITPELLITGSTGISRPLGDPAKIAEYLAGDQRTKLRRRLESDVKSLFAFYNYGLLHRRVRLRWGFLDEDLGVDWAQPGDPSLHGVLEEWQASGQEVEIVYGSAPGWSDPWSRSVRVRILSFDFMMVTVQVKATRHGLYLATKSRPFGSSHKRRIVRSGTKRAWFPTLSRVSYGWHPLCPTIARWSRACTPAKSPTTATLAGTSVGSR